MGRTEGASGDALRTPSSLAAIDDFTIGSATISPSRRIIAGPAVHADVEPRVMQVLVILAEAAGSVVTRETLFDRCWGGTWVGDDSLNRTIAAIRRLVAETAPGAFEIETIPRTGYRLMGEIIPAETGAKSLSATPPISRRLAIAGAAAAVLGVGGLLWLGRDRADPQAAMAMEKGRQALRDGWPGSETQGVKHFRQAVASDPGDAAAWGYLALALRNVAEQAPPAQISAAVSESESAARRALAIDPRNPNALTALATVRPEFGNWGTTEDSLRRILRIAPDNPAALTHLVLITQSVGRTRESWTLNERVAALEPLSPVHQYRRALKQWILGRVPESDISIDRALQLWPRHPAVWNARLYIFAFTGRTDAALAMLGDAATRPAQFEEETAEFWQASLRALGSRAPADIAAATQVNLSAAPRSPGGAVRAIMVLAMLGEIDTAFAVADGFLLRRGPLIGTLWQADSEMAVNDHYWRRTMNLFTPATAAMRQDPRFRGLCDGIGLTAYWKSYGGPDARYAIT